MCCQILVWRSGMKAPRMSKEQYKGIHDVVNDQGFARHYTCRAISNTVCHLEVFRCESILRDPGAVSWERGNKSGKEM